MAHRVGDRPRGVAVSGPLRLVLDTHVWLDLLVFDDPAVAPLRAALERGDAIALVEPRMRAELERVLGYPALAVRVPAREDVLATFAALSHAVDEPAATRPTPRCRDPDDQMFVDLALATGADALLSRDDALLRLAPRLRRAGIDVRPPAAWCAAPRPQISKR